MGCLGHQEDLILKVAGSHHRQVLSHAYPETTQPWVGMGAGTVCLQSSEGVAVRWPQMAVTSRLHGGELGGEAFYLQPSDRLPFVS